ncbi:MAG TPA: glycosyltransferase, partial [Terriglobia bacterium]|nr:glycosyltransferase [Terriglobia bacterium]
SRGDVELVLALAVQLKKLGTEVRICAPPDFREWIDTFGIAFVPVGPEVRQTATRSSSTTQSPPSPEQMRQLMQDTVTGQFEAITSAASGCDVLVAGMSLQFALHSVAEKLRIPYVYATWCPNTLPSPHHAPPPLPWSPRDGTADNRTLWIEQAKRWNEQFGPAINLNRESAGLAPVTDVQSHIITKRPWLAADQTIGPWPETADLDVVQTGAWIRSDRRPLSTELEVFLDAGDPPVYFGFSSMRAPQDLSQTMVQSARALGRRAIVSRGWADVRPPDDSRDCLSIGEENLQALFRRVAAAVHHGGAGTTTIAAQAGVPQVVVPQIWDQHYWAKRVQELGIGTAHAPGAPTADSLTEALRLTLQPEVAARARSVAASVRTDGAEVAARRLIDEVGRRNL